MVIFHSYVNLPEGIWKVIEFMFQTTNQAIIAKGPTWAKGTLQDHAERAL